VNLDAAESRTAPRQVDELERLGVPLKPASPPAVPSPQPAQRHHQAELENRQKLWRWLLLGAAGVMIVEIGLAGWVTRQRAIQTQPSA
jgi:anti-sigma-K factor RskA